jgi:hypothetical protein
VEAAVGVDALRLLSPGRFVAREFNRIMSATNRPGAVALVALIGGLTKVATIVTVVVNSE